MRSGRLIPLFITLVVVTIVSFGAMIYKNLAFDRSASFEDASGWVYKCSKPIRVKDQGVKYANGKPSLTPVNKQDVDKYCRVMGIE